MTYSSYLLHFPIQLMVVLGFTFLRRRFRYMTARSSDYSSARRLLAAYLSHRSRGAGAKADSRAVATAERSEGDCPGHRP